MEELETPLPPRYREAVDEAVQVIEGIRLFARPEILKFYQRDSCIGSTRVVFELLKRYDLNPRAVACQVNIYNAALIERINNEGRRPQSVEEIKRWSREDGSWNVGIGGTGQKRPGQWDGHLVCLSFGKVLIDVSIDQASRPQRNIHLSPIVFTAPDDWLKGERGTQAMVMEQGSLVVYMATPDERGWVQTPGWRGHAEIRREIVNNVAVKIENWLKDA